VSVTVNSTCASFARSRTSMLPSNVNLTAFDRRLRTMVSHMPRSTYTGSSSGGQSTLIVRPARSTAERKTLARSLVNAARSVGSKVASTRPASICEKSSSEFTIFRSRAEFLRSIRIWSRWAGDS